MSLGILFYFKYLVHITLSNFNNVCFFIFKNQIMNMNFTSLRKADLYIKALLLHAGFNKPVLSRPMVSGPVFCAMFFYSTDLNGLLNPSISCFCWQGDSNSSSNIHVEFTLKSVFRGFHAVTYREVNIYLLCWLWWLWGNEKDLYYGSVMSYCPCHKGPTHPVIPVKDCLPGIARSFI